MAIKCPKCHSEVLDDSRFCSKCGMPIHATEEEMAAFTKTLVTPGAGVPLGILLAGKYRIHEEIGHGGMGIVYKAEDVQLKRSVALKFLPPELSSNMEARERFLQEARAAAALSHPNICTIHEVGESEDKPFIAMEYIEGENLREKLRKGRLSIEEVLTITIEVAEGLEKAHQRGIVHRDVKSANIMVTDSGQAKIMDFGLAKLRGGTVFTKQGSTLGTVAYMSPEQARGEHVDGRTDIWSLGVVLYEMLTGELPFKGEREVSILYSIVHEEPKALKDHKPPVPLELQQIIERALAKNADSRYQTAAAMQSDLQGYRDALRMESAGALNLHSILKRLRRPAVAIPVVVALAAVAAVVVGILHRQAKVRRAEETLLPRIEELVVAESSGRDNLVDAYRLVVDAERYIPKNPKLADLAAKCSVTIAVETDPPGAQVSIQKYSEPAGPWQRLGVSPLKGVRLPMGIFRWRFEKSGYETVHAAAFTYRRDESRSYFNVGNDLMRVLDQEGGLPGGMVRVAGGEVPDIGPIDDFFIDRFEVTNRQFKEFVDRGGYQKREYWKSPLTKDGKTVTWEEGIAGFVDQTEQPGPSTWRAGTFPAGHEDHPVAGVSWYEAAAFAEYAGKSLPTKIHWDVARGTLTPLYQSGFLSVFYPMCNFMGEGPARVGAYLGMTTYGTYDMAGNVREWCWNETSHGRLLRGGGWNDVNYLFVDPSQAPPDDRSPQNGFRCVRYADPAGLPKSALEFIAFNRPDLLENLPVQTPVPDQVYQVYRDQFSYDAKALNARIESTDDTPRDWIKQKITFDTAYGGRMAAYLFLPKNARPPFQTVVYFPGSSAVDQRSSHNLEQFVWFEVDLTFLPQAGRAVLFPVYIGTFERPDPRMTSSASADRTSRAYVEYCIQLVKDFKRSIDYLESRDDIDRDRIAYFGFSWGGWMGAVITAVEERLSASIIKASGLRNLPQPVNPINYVTRVTLPTLMLNGKYDLTFPFEWSAKAMFDLLGTSPADKAQKVYDTDHYIPRNELIKETLAWLDKYLGPVNK